MKKIILRQLLMLSKRLMYGFLIQLFFCTVLLANTGNAQRKTLEEVIISVNLTDKSLNQFFRLVESKTDFKFTYTHNLVDLKQRVTVVENYKSVYDVLAEVSKQTDLNFVQVNENIHVKSPSRNAKNAEKISELLDVTINGKVTDENGDPLPGASVTVVGTTIGTVTDLDGNYSLTVPEDATLIFSYIGFEAMRIPVDNRNQIDVILNPDMSSLDEVVVVGFGEQKKVNLTGAVGAMDSKEIEKLNVTNTSQLLTGQVSGVTVSQNSGQPGKEGMSIRIRGMGTFSGAGNDPLVLVDGLASSMESVDFNDIANISVLKDAASAAIYGTRGANGVILIETKKGREGKVSVNYHGYIGFQQPTEIPQIVDSWQYAEMENEALVNMGRSPIWSSEDIAKFKSGEDQDNFPNKRHYDDLISSGSGIQTNHHLNILGGTAKNSYMVSFGFLNQEGLIAETSFNRYNMRVNLDNKLTDNIKLNVILSGRSAKDGEPTAVSRNPALGVGGLLNYAIKIPNRIPGKMSNGYYGHDTGFSIDGWMDSESFISNENKDFYANVSVDWDITPSLKITGRSGLDYNINKYQIFRPVLVLDQFFTEGPSDLRVRNSTNSLSTNQIFINYDLNFADHSFHFLGGYSQEYFRNDMLEGYRDNFPSNTLYQLNAGSQGNQQSFGSAHEWALRSYFGRMTYDFKEKYLFEINARYDGSSRFPEENRYGFFPSISGGWRISEESFFNIAAIEELKFRASWGKLGNQNIGNYPYQQVMTLGLNAPFGVSEVLFPGAAATVVPNPNVQWELTRVVNYGVDVQLFSGKLDFSVDYYDKLTSGILYNITASEVLGMTPSIENAGMVSNKGIDLALRHRNTIGNLTYSISTNFSYVKNEVQSLANVERDIANGLFVGYPLQSIFGYEALGLFVNQEDISNHAVQPRTPKPGTIKFKDISGPNGVPDGIVDADYDRKIIGNRFPKYNFGANFSAGYKGFDLSVLLQGVAGVDNLVTGYQGNAFQHASNPQRWMYEGRWTEANPDPNAVYPRSQIVSGGEEQFWTSTYIITDASFLRISNVQLGYTFPKSLITKLKMTNLRGYVSARNLHTFHNFREGWDPEMGQGYPPVRVLTVGINLNF